MKSLLTISLLSLCSFVSSAASVDKGKIIEIYTNYAGHVAIKLDTGFVNAEQNTECATGNGWVGIYEAHEHMIKAIYSAKENGSEVTVTTNGCEGSQWTKLNSIYIK